MRAHSLIYWTPVPSVGDEGVCRYTGHYSSFLIYQTWWFYIECTLWVISVCVRVRDSPFSGALCNHNESWLLPWMPAVHVRAKRVRQAAIFTISKQGLFLALFPSSLHSEVLSLPFSTTSQARSTPTVSLHFSFSFLLFFHLYSTN